MNAQVAVVFAILSGIALLTAVTIVSLWRTSRRDQAEAQARISRGLRSFVAPGEVSRAA